MKIQEPDWEDLFDLDYVKHPNGGNIPKVNLGKPAEWFRKHIAPYDFYSQDDAVEVQGYGKNDCCGMWYDLSKGISSAESDSISENPPSFKALLVNIEPIKKDTAEDVVRQFIEDFRLDWFPNDPKALALFERAKKVLGADKGNGGSNG